MRTYERTHPWISFTLDTRQFKPAFWLLVGEAQSKCEHVAGVPLRPDTAKRLHQLYLAKGVRATTAIEGNTLSEEQVVKRIQGELELPPSKEYLGKEIDNIINACGSIVDDIVADRPLTITADRIRAFNGVVLAGLEVAPEVQPGQVRKHNVGVFRYRGAPPEDCEFLLDRLCSWLAEFSCKPIEVTGIAEAILKAILAHLYLAWIHPFGDGNGRTARLVEFQVLVRAGVSTPAAHLLSNHYNETRSEYYRQLDYASQSGGDVTRFLEYAIRGLVDGLRAQIEVIQEQQFDVVWRNHVHEKFGSDRSGADQRQCALVLDLSRTHKATWVAVSDLSKLSPRLAAMYAGRTRRTLARDLNRLSEMGLVEHGGARCRAKTEIIRAFLPVRRQVQGRVAPHSDPVGPDAGAGGDPQENGRGAK